MLAMNHGMTGMILGSILPLPLAIPVAFASHFLLDTVPHYGTHNNRRNSNNAYKTIVLADTFIALSLAVICAFYSKWAMFWIGWVAYSPDGYWVYMYFKTKSFYLKPTNAFARFHKNIQRERPWGLLIELPITFLLAIASVHYLMIK